MSSQHKSGPRSSHIINESEIEWMHQTHGDRYEVRRRPLAKGAGGRELGCSLYEMPPGKKGWPFHYHSGNEEAIYILSGQGLLRLGRESHPVGPGDYIALPAGPEAPHQLENPGAEVLRYLVFSTMKTPDVMVYPDSNKIGVFAGAAPGGEKSARFLDGFWSMDATVDYWQGEE